MLQRRSTSSVGYVGAAPPGGQRLHAVGPWAVSCGQRAGELARFGEVQNPKAIEREAGTKAFERSANRAAVSLLEKALTALGHLPQNADTRQQAFAVHLDLRSSLYALGESDRVVHHLEAAKAVAESLGDRRRLGLVYGHWAPFSDMAGDHHHALASGERALALADSLEDHRARVVGTYSIGLTNIYLGNYRAAADSLRRTIGLLDPDGVSERFGMAFPAAVAARAYLGLALAELGAFADATAIGGQAVEIAEAINHPQSRIFAAYHLGYDYLRQGNFEAGIRILEQALVLVDEADCPGHLPFAACIAGTAYARGGRLDAGFELVKRGVEASKSMKIRGARSLLVRLHGETLLLAGDAGLAGELAREALDRAVHCHERGWEAWARWLLGEAAARSESGADAVDHYEHARRLAVELGMRPLEAHCHHAVGTFRRRQDQRIEARGQLAIAARTYRELAMPYWEEQAESELRAMAD